MLDQLKAFENKPPEIVFEWKDPETEAEGWVVINSLKGGAAGGGTRMRKGLSKHEVTSLAKTMEIKFSICGPPIGGAKSGINFDPADPRKEAVLNRWFKAVLPLLQNYYGTGGDLNVDEVKEVLPITRKLGLNHCQEGVVQGHFNPTPKARASAINRLQEGVSKIIESERYSPNPQQEVVIADMITGFGVAESVLHYYKLINEESGNKRVVVQGFGNVGGAAAFFLAQAGLKIVGIIDRNGGIIRPEGIPYPEITELWLTREGNALAAKEMIPFEAINQQIWETEAEVFLPCAQSRILHKAQAEKMINNGLELISCGANVPFADPEIFLGETAIYVDNKIAVIPDFIANCGMARTFAYLMENEGPLTDEAIFKDVSDTIEKALKTLGITSANDTGLWQRGLQAALNNLNPPKPTS